ncbi:PEST proteolytic signal-containing nuclear protein isoform X1 [Ammospiza caudacuta]|uniref:PEST proteolytic signal-containing nuclear protein isoform X1 n=1 Tax=Ammospiza caudacuta TaxID=2857398 RepID=UPI002738C367|nr:PEST proteolytic signal-containing nuclear protein isoform X1 [Ammospiza caudacuta]
MADGRAEGEKAKRPQPAGELQSCWPPVQTFFSPIAPPYLAAFCISGAKSFSPDGRNLLCTGGPEEEAEKPVKTKTVSSSNGGESSSRSAEKRAAHEEAEDFATKPAPAKMSKFGFAIGSQTTKKASAISIKLGANKPKEPVPTLAPKTLSVAAAFNEDEDSEPEEMPPEAKMRMKNIGRDTPTSAGPNSFNKGKHGFSDNQKLWERNIKSHLGNVHDQENN